jgi:hypothetical protein
MAQVYVYRNLRTIICTVAVFCGGRTPGKALRRYEDPNLCMQRTPQNLVNRIASARFQIYPAVQKDLTFAKLYFALVLHSSLLDQFNTKTKTPMFVALEVLAPIKRKITLLRGGLFEV